MSALDVFDIDGKKVDSIEVPEEIFFAPVRPYLHTEIVTWQRATRRVGTQSALTKREVSGSTKKPFAQKGTGRARQGSSHKNPHQRGGGVAFAPKPRSYEYAMPKSKRRAALVSALSARVQEGRLRIIDKIDFSEPKTKRVVGILDAFQASQALIVDGKNSNLAKSARNIPHVKYLENAGLNVFDILKYPFVFLSLDTVQALKERMAA